MPLDPRIRTFLEQTGLLMQPGSTPRKPEVLLAAQRANDEQAKLLAAQNHVLAPVAHVEDRVIPGPAGDIPVRLYVPEGTGPFPVLMYFHGGGWVSGNLDTHDLGCRLFCRKVGCLVLAVDYRLPPEHKFPAGLEDCYAATCWMVAHASDFQGNPAQIAVAGDSGGGNFAAAIALMARDRGGPALQFQLLTVPVLDFQLTTPSWRDYDGYIMLKEEFLIARDFYLNTAEEQWHPYASPSLAPDLHSLPPALIITAECDPVRDAGEHYGQRLREAGIPVTISRYNGMVHSFMGMKALVPEAKQAFEESVQALRIALATSKNNH